MTTKPGIRMITEGGMFGGLWAIVVAIYAGITGHQYSRIGTLETKIDKQRDHAEKIYVTKETFEANMDAIQQSNVATAKYTDSQTRSQEELFRLINTKADKQ